MERLFSQQVDKHDKDYTEIPSKVIRLFNTMRNDDLFGRFRVSYQDVLIYLYRGKGEKKKRQYSYDWGSKKYTKYYYNGNRKLETIQKNTGYCERTVVRALDYLNTLKIIDTGRGHESTCNFEGRPCKDAESEGFETPKYLVIDADFNECHLCPIYNKVKKLNGGDEYFEFKCSHRREIITRKSKIEIPYSKPFTRIRNDFLDWVLSVKEEPARNLLWYLIIYSLKNDDKVKKDWSENGCSIRRIHKEFGYSKAWLLRAIKKFEEVGLIMREEHGDGKRNYADVIHFNHKWNPVEHRWEEGCIYHKHDLSKIQQENEKTWEEVKNVDWVRKNYESVIVPVVQNMTQNLTRDVSFINNSNKKYESENYLTPTIPH